MISFNCIGAALIICVGLFLFVYTIIKPVSISSFADTFSILNIPVITFKIKDSEYNFIVDTGSSSSHIQSELAKKYGENYTGIDVSCTGAGSEINFSGACRIDLTKDKYVIPEVLFFSSPALDASLLAISDKFNISIHGLLGGDFLDQHKFIINYCNQQIYKK